MRASNQVICPLNFGRGKRFTISEIDRGIKELDPGQKELDPGHIFKSLVILI